MTHAATADKPASNALRGNPLLDRPITPMLVRLAIPNLLAMIVSSVVTLAETRFIGELGTHALAGMALAFPMVLLQGMLSAGAMGGGMSSAVSRALGANDVTRANALVMHATVIGAAFGLLFMVLMLAFGPQIYRLLGGTGEALSQALAYSNVVFVAVIAIWLNNTFASVMRGTGNMRVPSATLIGIGLLQAILAGAFGLGWGPFPRWGMFGIGLGIALSNVLGMLVFLYYLRFGRMRVRLSFRTARFRREMFLDILKVGGFSVLGPTQSMATILILTALMSRQGTEVLAGFGIGIRMEFLLIPITFAVGVAAAPMVGMAIGAGDVARARRVAWTAAGLASLVLGVLGLMMLVGAEWIASFFSGDARVIESARQYFVWAGPFYAMFGLAHCLYFASQGAGRMLAPVLAGSARLSVVLLGGWLLISHQAPAWMFYSLVSISMLVYGVAACVGMKLASWQPTRASS